MNVAGFKKIQSGINVGCWLLALTLRVQAGDVADETGGQCFARPFTVSK